MKILLVSNKVKTYNLGFQNEIEPLLELGHEVVWAADFSSFVGDRQTAIPFETRHIDIKSSPFDKRNRSAYRDLLAILDEGGYDAVQSSTPIGGMLARMAAKKKKIPLVIYEAHGFLFFDGAPLVNRTVYKAQEHLMSRWTDVLVTINDEDYRAAQKMKLKKGGKLFMIHGAGVEVGQSRDCDRAAVRRDIGIADDAVAIVSAGILNKNKNNRVIIEALALAKSEKLCYVVCGEGDEESELRALAESLGVADRVHFLGFRTDMKQIMLACDVFAMPSFREGVPRALLEAMDLGLPCIGTRTRGIRELIGNDKLLCGGSSPKEFAEAIDYVVGNPEECEKIIERNVNEAKLYSKERVRAEYTAIYREVLK